MSREIQLVDIGGHKYKQDVEHFPDHCPACHKGIQAVFLGAYTGNIDNQFFFAVFLCPRTECHAAFTARYGTLREFAHHPAFLYGSQHLVHEKRRAFSANITQVSPMFCEIFEQAETAEQNGLLLIAGPGYRKALEYLVKDYLVSHIHCTNETAQASIKAAQLATCIGQYLQDGKIKAMAERAAWLGNDETHYVRKWTDKDLADLKSLISVTVHWIDMSVESDRYLASMTDGKRANKAPVAPR